MFLIVFDHANACASMHSLVEIQNNHFRPLICHAHVPWNLCPGNSPLHLIVTSRENYRFSWHQKVNEVASDFGEELCLAADKFDFREKMIRRFEKVGDAFHELSVIGDVLQQKQITNYCITVTIWIPDLSGIPMVVMCAVVKWSDGGLKTRLKKCSVCEWFANLNTGHPYMV